MNLDFLELGGRSYGIVSSVKDVLVNDTSAKILGVTVMTSLTEDDLTAMGYGKRLLAAVPGMRRIEGEAEFDASLADLAPSGGAY